MKFSLTLIFALFQFLSYSPSNSKSTLPTTGVYLKKTFQRDRNTLPYRILYPKAFDGIKKFPVLFFLHGSGERGRDNESQLMHGSKLFLDSIEKYPCIVIFPQCDTGDFWANIRLMGLYPDSLPRIGFYDMEHPGPSLTLLNMLIDSIISAPTTETSQLYLAGLSMGGMGTAQLLAIRPNTFAAATVICGAAPLSYTENLTKTPTQIFQGLKDNVVSPIGSQEYFDAIDDNTGTHRLFMYTEADHVSWNNAFAEPDFLHWIFKHRK